MVQMVAKVAMVQKVAKVAMVQKVAKVSTFESQRFDTNVSKD